jgi:hypothetical protein
VCSRDSTVIALVTRLWQACCEHSCLCSAPSLVSTSTLSSLARALAAIDRLDYRSATSLVRLVQSGQTHTATTLFVCGLSQLCGGLKDGLESWLYAYMLLLVTHSVCANKDNPVTKAKPAPFKCPRVGSVVDAAESRHQFSPFVRH